MSNLTQSVLVRWLVAVIGFPVGGFLGYLVAGSADTVPAALISGAIAGAIIGLAQGFALSLPPRALATWAAATGIGLAVALGAVTAAIGQISTTTEAVALGAISGLVLGAGQAVVLQRQGLANGWLLVPASAVAWAAGWFVTTGIGVALATGWPVYGLSGAIASQVITGLVIWRLVTARPPQGATAA